MIVDSQGEEFAKMFAEEKGLIHAEIQAWDPELRARARVTATLQWPRDDRAPARVMAERAARPVGN